jgi:glycosyltransferase involved in cell wall biosynthesis
MWVFDEIPPAFGYASGDTGWRAEASPAEELGEYVKRAATFDPHNHRQRYAGSELEVTADQQFVSVVIPVFNNVDGLARCLECLAEQTLPRDRFEVLVVDNGSREAVRLPASCDLSVTVLQEPVPGSYAARNRGIRNSRAEIIALTDSDCTPATSWLEAGLGALRDHPGGIVAGKIECRFACPSRPTVAELYDSTVPLMRQEEVIAAHGFGATANLFVRREVFDQVGMFDEGLKSGGDREWGQRAASHGFATGYAEVAIVYHPARRSLGELVRKARRVKGGLHQLEGHPGMRQRALQVLADFKPPIRRLRAVLGDRSLSTLNRRIAVAGVLVTLKYVVALEGLRLLLGGTPQR